MSTKLDEMYKFLDSCPDAGTRCICIQLKCLVESCPSEVAGHGCLVCGFHHDAYCDSGGKLFLVVWAALQP